jgi:DNA-binding GntR family transcriptional regulator
MTDKRPVLAFQPIRARRVFEEICDRVHTELASGIDRVDELTRAGRLRGHLDYSVRFYPILAAATGNEVLALVIDAPKLTVVLRHVVARVGPDPRPDLVDVRRRFLKHLRARDVEKAAAEMSDSWRSFTGTSPRRNAAADAARNPTGRRPRRARGAPRSLAVTDR